MLLAKEDPYSSLDSGHVPEKSVITFYRMIIAVTQDWHDLARGVDEKAALKRVITDCEL